MPEKGEFKVHGSAAVKRPKKLPKLPKAEPVKITRVSPAALKAAHEAVRGRDVHLVVNRDGSIEIRNGRKEPK